MADTLNASQKQKIADEKRLELIKKRRELEKRAQIEEMHNSAQNKNVQFQNITNKTKEITDNYKSPKFNTPNKEFHSIGQNSTVKTQNTTNKNSSENTTLSNKPIKENQLSNTKANSSNNSDINFARRSSLSNENRYSSDRLKNAQYEYDMKMHTPSAITAKLTTNINISGVVGSSFGHAAQNISKTSTIVARRTVTELAQMGQGVVANDEGSRKVMDTLKYMTQATTAVGGDILAVGKRSWKTMSNATSMSASLDIKRLSELNPNTLEKYWGNKDLSRLSEAEIKNGCVKFLREHEISISDNFFKQNSAKIVKKLNVITKKATEEDVKIVLNALKGTTLKKPFKKPEFRPPRFRLIRVGVMMASSLKYKFLSNEEMRGISIIVQAKDKIVSIARTALRFFHSVKKAAQKGAVLARKAVLTVKRTKLYNRLYAKHTSKLIKKYEKRVGRKSVKHLSKRINKRTAKAAQKAGEEARKLGLRAQMTALRNQVVKRVAKAALKKIVATKVGEFVVTKISESALFHVFQHILTDWIPVIGQIKFFAEIIITVLLVVFIIVLSLQIKTFIDDIGNAASYPNESLTRYCDTLATASEQYKRYYRSVMNRDSLGIMYDGKQVPRLLSDLTGNVNVQFNDYMAVESYETSDVESEQLRELYGNQPELIIMAHVMSEMSLHYNDPVLEGEYKNRLSELYNSSHIMYITYYQKPKSIKRNLTDFETIYQQYWDEDEQIYKNCTEKVEDIEYDYSTDPPTIIADNGEIEVPITINYQVPVKTADLKCSWNADVAFDVYYYDNLFDFSKETIDNVKLTQPQVYVKYNQGMNSVHTFGNLPGDNPNVEECMTKVNIAVSDKLNELGISGADPMAITCGIVSNLISEGGCRSNNYEDSFNKTHAISDEQVTEIYNGYLESSTFEEVWTQYIKGVNHNNVKLSGGYGIVQWYSEGRKQGLFRKAFDEGKNIDDLDMQIDFMIQEMVNRGYFSPGGIYTSGANPAAIGYYLCEHYEAPASVVYDHDYSVCTFRGERAAALYNKYNGIIGDIDYDDENIGDYIKFVEGSDSGWLSLNQQNINNYNENTPRELVHDYDTNIFIQEYLTSQGYRYAPQGNGSIIANIYLGNYGPFKDATNLATGDIIAWDDYGAIYLGNGRVLCTISLNDEKATDIEIIGKFLLSDIVNLRGSDYVIVSPIKNEETSTD